MKNRHQAPGTRHQDRSIFSIAYCLLPIACRARRGFTLIETLVAVSLLSIAIVAPMSLTTKSLSAAYYARDQITAFHLAQEAIEAIRHARDHNILQNAFGTQVDLLSGLPDTNGNPFIVDTRNDDMDLCAGNCPPVQIDSVTGLYGYRTGCIMPTNDCGAGEGWENSRFTRTVHATFLPDTSDEVRITVDVSWKTGVFQSRTVTIADNLYRWVNDGSGTE